MRNSKKILKFNSLAIRSLKNFLYFFFFLIIIFLENNNNNNNKINCIFFLTNCYIYFIIRSNTDILIKDMIS
jgi:hypothetical protein